jgi:hypothetical protein
MKNLNLKLVTIFIINILSCGSLKPQPDYSFANDNSGNRTELNVITLKSAEISGFTYDSTAFKAPCDSTEKFVKKTSDTEILIFPNPTRGIPQIKIKTTIWGDIIKIIVYNNNGVMVLKKETINQRTVSDLSGEPLG